MPVELSDLAKDFLKEEQKQRRNEIENLIGRVETDLRYGLAITGLFWSWLATNHEKLTAPFRFVAVFIPAIVMAFFYRRWFALDKTILQVSEYTRQVERTLELPQGLGWESHIEQVRGGPNCRAALAISTMWYWRLLIGANVALGIAFLKLT